MARSDEVRIIVLAGLALLAIVTVITSVISGIKQATSIPFLVATIFACVAIFFGNLAISEMRVLRRIRRK